MASLTTRKGSAMRRLALLETQSSQQDPGTDPLPHHFQVLQSSANGDFGPDGGWGQAPLPRDMT